jgi:XTP/dITP diphosphohydrolase
MHPDLKSIQLQNREQKLIAFERLLQTMEELRALCPWDRKQDWDSLRPLTIEETYELADAILEKDTEGVKEELGDLMLHLVFYAKIAEEKNDFSITEVMEDLCDKLVERHPHIYAEVIAETEDAVKKNWEELKLKSGKKGVLAGVPHSLPAMIKAYRMQEKTAQIGFQWEKKKDVWDKVEEEMEEFKTAQDSQEKEDEFGDLLFSLINYARYEGIDPEMALAKTNLKFKSRFEFIEENASRPLKNLSLEEMDQLWDKAKGEE